MDSVVFVERLVIQLVPEVGLANVLALAQQPLAVPIKLVHLPGMPGGRIRERAYRLDLAV